MIGSLILIHFYYKKIQIKMSGKDKYYDWYRVFLQMMMSSGVITGQDVYKKKREKIHLQISRTKEKVKTNGKDFLLLWSD